MKIPCEIVVWYVLPTIRREIAKELVRVHGLKQAVVARKFEVTDAAISQYITRKRGENEIIQNSKHYDAFIAEIQVSAEKLVSDDCDFAAEVCRLCGVVKECGMLAEIYEGYTGYKPPRCALPDKDVQYRMSIE
ncbi:MAG TPA: transcriptional regulator [Candidatus Methanomethylophilaceae archaeon]|nr:transcriptional regulator [Candidatus Methanomethylophilaceae archaeon]